MTSELWHILPHTRQRFDRRVKIELGQPVRFGDIGLVLMRNRVDGEPGPVRMVWEMRGSRELEVTALTEVNLREFGDWVPVAVSSQGTVLFNVLAPAWPMTMVAP